MTFSSLPYSENLLLAAGPVGVVGKVSTSSLSRRVSVDSAAFGEADCPSRPRGIGPDDIDEAFANFLDANGYREMRAIGDGMYACLMPLLFTCAIVTGQIGDVFGYEDRWCFHDYVSAKAALNEWRDQDEPTGWHRHPGTGRRRPDGDAAREYINR